MVEQLLNQTHGINGLSCLQQQADYWDDSELIDHWDKTMEAYRVN